MDTERFVLKRMTWLKIRYLCETKHLRSAPAICHDLAEEDIFMKKLIIFVISLCFISTEANSLPRGKVGTIPDYPVQKKKIEHSPCFFNDEPEISVVDSFTVEIHFKTRKSTPASSVYYGIFEPDQQLQLPRYRHKSSEKLKGRSRSHSLKINLGKMMHPIFDATGMKEKGEGIVAYRLEIYDPKSASSHFFDGRFAFRGDERVPCIIEGPFIDQVTRNSAIISFETDLPVFARVNAGNSVFTSGRSKAATHFEIPLAGLKPGNEITYQVHLEKDDWRYDSREYHFVTEAKRESEFTFAVMGDSREGKGGGERAFGGVNYHTMSRFAMDACNQGAAFIIMTGDLVNGGTTDAHHFEKQLQAYKDAIEPVSPYIPVYEVMGNHEITMDIYDLGDGQSVAFDKQGDLSSEAIFAGEFVNPENGPVPEKPEMPPYSENVYYFDYGNARFIIMNNNYWWSSRPEEYGGNLEGYVLDDQYEWLLKLFEESSADTAIKHLFLYAQEPMFPNSGHTKDGMWYHGGDKQYNDGIDRRYIVERRDEIWRAFANTGKAVAGNFGDEHCYHRMLVTKKQNPDFIVPVWQLVSGGAGAPYYAQNKDVPWADEVDAFSTQLNYTLFKVHGDSVELEVYGITGELIDRALLKPFPMR